MQSIPRQHNSLVSNCVYQTDEYRKNVQDIYNGRKNVEHSPMSAENCTQTSKTILELAQLEFGNITPDSLSPKGDSNKNKKKLVDNSKLHLDDIYLPYNRRKYVVEYLNSQTNFGDEPETEKDTCLGMSLTETFLEKKEKHKGDSSFLKHQKSTFLQQSSPLNKIINKDSELKSKSCVEDLMDHFEGESKLTKVNTRFTIKNVKDSYEENNTKPVKYFCQHNSNLKLPKEMVEEVVFKTNFIKEKKENSFMSPTIASINKNQSKEIEFLNNLLSPLKRCNLSPQKKHGEETNVVKNIPYIDCDFDSQYSENTRTINAGESPPSTFTQNMEKFKINLMSDTNSILESNSVTSNDLIINQALNKLKLKDWNVALRGLLEIIDFCRNHGSDLIYPHMTFINQRLLELLRSPRSHVCRTACQSAGCLFEHVKDTRRPEFDEIVDTLLCRTADCNKFIRQDANLSLDCMVTHVPMVHSVRALCARGPFHKNYLVRTATARLLICVIVINGPEKILMQGVSDNTRKKIFTNMTRFMDDRNGDTRKLGERLFKLLNKDVLFEIYLRKYLDKDDFVKMKKKFRVNYK